MLMDDYGSSFLRQPSTWLPEPVLADKCFEALAELERVVEGAGATLIVATVPLQPEWQARYDPKGTFINSFEERVRSALTAPSTLFIRGSRSATESPAACRCRALHMGQRRQILGSSGQRDCCAAVVCARFKMMGLGIPIGVHANVDQAGVRLPPVLTRKRHSPRYAGETPLGDRILAERGTATRLHRVAAGAKSSRVFSG